MTRPARGRLGGFGRESVLGRSGAVPGPPSTPSTRRRRFERATRVFFGAPARTPWFSSQTMPIGELFTISISPSPSKSMGCIDDAPWPCMRAGSSAAASATMLRLIYRCVAMALSFAAQCSFAAWPRGSNRFRYCANYAETAVEPKKRRPARSTPRPARRPASRRRGPRAMLDCYEPQGQPNGSLFALSS